MKKVQVIILKKTGEKYLYLLMKRRGPKIYWQGVTGGVEKFDKSIKNAAIREIKEELGIEIVEKRIIGPIHTFEFITSQKEFYGKKATEYCFYSIVDENCEIILSDEHTECRWEEFAKAIEIIEYNDPKIVLKKINDMILGYQKTIIS